MIKFWLAKYLADIVYCIVVLGIVAAIMILSAVISVLHTKWKNRKK